MPTTDSAPAVQLRRRYTRSDPRGLFPRGSGLPDLDENRLAIFWRPIIDMTDSEFAPMRLRMIRHVSGWLAEPVPGRWSWFAMIGVSGLRHQVLRHAGLEHWDCADPTALPEELRTPQWRTLARAVAGYADLEPHTRALVVFQLAQLSYCDVVLRLAGTVRPTGEPDHDRYAYEVARVTTRVPGRTPASLAVFDEIARRTPDPTLALAASAQGIGHSIRNGGDTGTAGAFEEHGNRLLAAGPAEDWHGHLVRSRYHRAVALLRLAQRAPEAMREEIAAATEFSDRLFAADPQGTDRLVAEENLRILVESRIKAASRARGAESAAEVTGLCEQLLALDPYCVEARLVAGDGFAAIGDHAEAARRYARAGELGTGAGAVAWFRAGQCYEAAGDRAAAVDAMARCLELDSTAVEPRAYLTAAA